NEIRSGIRTQADIAQEYGVSVTNVHHHKVQIEKKDREFYDRLDRELLANQGGEVLPGESSDPFICQSGQSNQDIQQGPNQQNPHIQNQLQEISQRRNKN